MATPVNEILFPVFTNDANEYKKTGNPFAYYTNADTALKILRSQSIWMRKPSMMNDFSEIEHGLDCLKEAYTSIEGEGFRGVLDKLHHGISNDIDSIFSNTISTIKTYTYIACFTKHDRVKEDNIGRLSMWRAYGKNNGIAFIFKPELFFNNYTALQTGVINSPVAYFNATKIKETLNIITANIHKHADEIKAYPRQDLQNLILSVYSMAVMCNKHYGFVEEQEWRAITYPPIFNNSPFITESVELIGGTPQKVKIFKFQAVPDISDLTIQNLLQKIIIGPCAHPEVTKDALSDELTKLGFPNPENIIHISNIPLRLN
jgi:hypothetical protein